MRYAYAHLLLFWKETEKFRVFSRIALVLAAVAIALSPVAARSDEAVGLGKTGAITGSVHAAGGAPVAGAQIVLSGASAQHTATDANGLFAFTNLPIGLYKLEVSKGGYLPAAAQDLAVVAGSTLNENVVLQQPDLSSLRTIATVHTSMHSSINTSATAETVVSAQHLQDLANPQINEALQQIPGVNIQRTGSAPNTSISIGGAQPYESQVLLDGHPLSTGRYGSWISQYFNSFMLGGIEVEVGPGNTTPFAGNAIGGTANFITPSYRGRAETKFVVGMDNYASQYADFLKTGKLGDKFSYVFAVGYNSENGPYQGNQGCIVKPSNPNQTNLPGSTGIIQTCGSIGAPLFQKGEVIKGHYDFSGSTSLELAYIGSQSGFYPQASSYGQWAGNMKIVPCITVSGAQQCTNPNFSQYVGKTINGYIFYPGSNVFNDQPIWEGQFRTAIGNNTLLIRPYAGSVLRDIDGAGEALYPNYYTAAGTEKFQGPYTTFELDKLHGTTVSFVHPFGDNDVTATYDYHSDDTYAQAGDPTAIPFPVAVPDTIARTNIFSLTGNFAVAHNTSLAAGLYDTNWKLNGWQAFEATPTSKPLNVPLGRTVNHFDPHVALTFSPAGGLSYRASFGSSVNFPYAGNISGVPFLLQPSATAPNGTTLVQKNPFLQPEVAHAWGLGVDKRFHDGSVVSFDYLNTNVNDVFETLTSEVDQPTYVYTNLPINAANLRSQIAMLKYSYLPNFGFGYYVSAAAQRSIVNGIPLAAFPATFSVPANGVQQCGTGSSICIPYLKGYGQLQYTFRDRTFVSFGADYEGKNNSYNQGPIAIFNTTFRRPVNKFFDVQISADNVFNSDAYNNLVVPNLGVPLVGENNKGQYGSYTTPIIPAQPRTIRLQLNIHDVP